MREVNGDDDAVSYMGLPAITCQSVGGPPPRPLYEIQMFAHDALCKDNTNNRRKLFASDYERM